MANDLSTMMSEVRQWFDVTSTRLADVPLKRIINDVIKDLYRRGDFGFLQDTDTSISTVNGTQSYTLPASIGRMVGVYLTKSGDSWWMKYAEPKAFQETYVGSSDTGTPLYFTIWSGQLLLGPTPDGTYAVSIMHFEYPEDLEDPADTHAFMTYCWDVILYGALAECAKYLMESERVAEFLTEYSRRFNRFLIDQTRINLAGQRPVSYEPGGEL